MKKFSIFAVIIVLLLSACSQTTVPQQEKEVVLDASYFLSLATKTEEFKATKDLLLREGVVLDFNTAELKDHESTRVDPLYHLVIFDKSYEYMLSFDFDKVELNLTETFLTRVTIDLDTLTTTSLDVNLVSLESSMVIRRSSSEVIVIEGYSRNKLSLSGLLTIDYSRKKDVINTLDTEDACKSERFSSDRAERDASSAWRHADAAGARAIAADLAAVGICAATLGWGCAAAVGVALSLSMAADNAISDARDADKTADEYYELWSDCLVAHQ